MRVTGRVGHPESVRSGPYAGGIGAGGFQVLPDGRFARCHIFNEWQSERELNIKFVHVDTKGVKRILQLGEVLRAHGVIEGVNRIELEGEFPRIRTFFPEAGVTVEYTSFFSPGDAKNSSLPAILVRVRGKGKLMFLIDNRFDCMPKAAGDHRVFLESPEGALAVDAPKAKVTALPRWAEYLSIQTFGGYDWWTMPLAKRGPHMIKAVWEGEFDDEFVLGWHFAKTMKDYEGRRIGSYYGRHFKDCRAVVDYVTRKKRALKAKSERFRKGIFGSRLPKVMKEAYSAQLFTFVKQSWFDGKGRFGVWEGSCSCCGLQTTDVSFYGSWLYVKLLPMLEKSGLRLTRKFQRKSDGWIPHFFPGTFERIDEYRRQDMNTQFVLMVFRDAVLWKDRSFVREMWPAVEKAMACARAMDKDGDMLPEVGPAAQTFDSWGFKGTAIYTATLWMGALKAAAKMARDLGHAGAAAGYEADFERARGATIAKLWNGKYFILAVDGAKRDPGCLIDALAGDWYCRLLGLGGILPDRMVVSHLDSVWRLNRKRVDRSYMKAYETPGETGWCYVNGGYPDRRRVGFQQYEPWTGMEYAYALQLDLMGMRNRALRVVKDIHDRKVRCGMVWNHVECGGDYFRPMIIGALWDRFRK